MPSEESYPNLKRAMDEGRVKGESRPDPRKRKLRVPSDPLTDKLTDEAMADDLQPMTLTVCGLCRRGAGGECHSPGCSFYLNRAPDLPLAARESDAPPNEEWAKLKRDSEILAYVAQTLNEHGAPTHDSEGRKLSVNGRLVDFLAAPSPTIRERELERLREAVQNVLGWDWVLTLDSADWPPSRDAAVQHLRAALDAVERARDQETTQIEGA